MDQQGPVLETLTRRLAEIPVDFLAEPHTGSQGRIHVAAVVQDLLTRLSEQAPPGRMAPFVGSDAARDRNRLSIVLILCWLLDDEWFRQSRPSPDRLLEVLSEASAELAQVASAKLVTDPERREELARLVLARLDYYPAGETRSQAQDRLMSLSSTERAKVLKASREAEERARAIREALRKKAAEESADKWTRE